MNQQCKVCGEPAAGFHFGAFTCEGCKSFFGRSYNNLSSISECKNGGECVINKKNRTACKACRLRKCLLVGMSKSGSRYGRRSNWFKIHCLLQEQQQQQQQQQQHHRHHHHSLQRHYAQNQRQRSSPPSPSAMVRPAGQRRSKDEAGLALGLDDYKHSTSPSVSSPESHNSDGSVEVSERRAAYAVHPGFRPLHPAYPHGRGDLSALGKEMMNLPLGFHLAGMPLLPPSFLSPPGLTVFSPYLAYGAHHPRPTIATSTTSPMLSPAPGGLTVHAEPFEKRSRSSSNNNNDDDCEDPEDVCRASNNNNRNARNHNVGCTDRRNVSLLEPFSETSDKRFYLDAILESQRTPPRGSPASSATLSGASPDRDLAPPQEDPIDLSVGRIDSSDRETDDDDDDRDGDDYREERVDGPPSKRRPVDLTTRS